MKRSLVSFFAIAILIHCELNSQPTFGTESFISSEKGILTIFSSAKQAPLLAGSDEWPGVLRAFKDLQSDISKVTSSLPDLYTDKIPGAEEIILVGTIGRSKLIDELVKKKKLNVDGIAGKWETFVIQVVKRPFRGVRKALVIAGSDKRGTIFGIYEVSRQIGVLVGRRSP
jgi:hypothetical protein